jgi:hypothetical protein
MSSESYHVGLDVSVLVGRPPTPPVGAAVMVLAGAVRKLPGVTEAHLVHAFIPGVSEEPALVLILVLAGDARPDGLMHALRPQLEAIVPQGEYLDVWPISEDHRALPSIRAADCRIV